MANQYSGSFEYLVREKFSCSAEELLSQFSEEGVTYLEAERKTGVSQSTIRKWSKRFGIELPPNEGTPYSPENDLLSLFRAPDMNSYNFLSRKWGRG